MAPIPLFVTIATPPGGYTSGGDTMTVGQSAALRLPLDTAEPQFVGTPVESIPMVSTAPGESKQWELRAVEPGSEHDLG